MLQPGAKVAVTMPIVPCRIDAGRSSPISASVRRGPRICRMKVSPPVKLGERKLDGETVAGSRIEATIPAGAIGNEQPITMSAEQWYGKDLQVVVEATYRDPRTGETRYRLSDIDRAEPDAAYSRCLRTIGARRRRRARNRNGDVPERLRWRKRAVRSPSKRGRFRVRRDTPAHGRISLRPQGRARFENFRTEIFGGRSSESCAP